MARSDRWVRVFCSEAEAAELVEKYEPVERYGSFVVLRVESSRVVSTIARRHPIEDITEDYQLVAGGQSIDTGRPRAAAVGSFHSHPSYRGAKRLTPGRHHHLVQFKGPIKKTWIRKIRKLGGDIRAPYAGFTMIVRCDEATLRRIVAESFVRWAGHLPHARRICRPSKTDDARTRRTKRLDGLYVLEFFDGDDLKEALPKLRRKRIEVLSQDSDGAVATVDVGTKKTSANKAIEYLSGVHGVREIRRMCVKRASIDVAAGLVGTTQTSSPGFGLDGTGEIVAICDTGLDSGDPSNIHPDFAGRIHAIKSYPITEDFAPYIDNPGGNDGPADEDTGHGTHVAGAAVGSGAASVGLPDQPRPIRGLAHRARLVFQAVEQKLEWSSFTHQLQYGKYLLAGIPSNIKKLFSYAYKQGARIHSNSWGGGDPGAYDAQCRQLDKFVWKKRDFCILVAAGNDGSDQDADGKINRGSVTSPGTAKNCITVGASESVRADFASDRYGDWWPDDYPAAPFNSDPMADDEKDVAAFSSRGPTEDGRTKPDVVAPGTFILSARSRELAPNNFAWGRFSKSDDYFFMGGTSMATPVTAGAVAVLRQYFREWVGFAEPSAAMLKAALIHSAERLPGYGGPNTIRDPHQGYGIINVDAIVDPPAPTDLWFVDDDVGLETGEQDEHVIQVQSSGAPLKLTLAYTDHPGAELINNLNLILTSPAGETYVGNGSKKSKKLKTDAKNNVEVIRIDAPASGTWTAQVVAGNVPEGPQRYALVVGGAVTM